MTTRMKLQLVPAVRGAVWLRQGLGAFIHRPVAFSALFATFLFALFASALVPILGPFLIVACLPLVSLAFMIATQQALQGGSPTPAVFALPLRSGRARAQALVKLGLIYALALLLISLLCHWLDGGKVVELMILATSEKGIPEAQSQQLLLDPDLRLGVFSRMGLWALLSLTFWYAPALVHWGGHSAAKALFFSVVAVWRNKMAFVVYLVSWVGAGFAFGLLESLLMSVFGEAIALIVGPAATLMLFTVLYTSLFFSFIDTFELSIDPPQGTPP